MSDQTEILKLLEEATSLSDSDEHRKLAIEKYTKVIEISPDYSKAYEQRGHIYRKLNQKDLAIDDFSKLIYLSPNDAKGYVARGKIYLSEENYTKALSDINKAIALGKNSIGTLSLISDVIWKKSDLLDLDEVEKFVDEYEAYVNTNTPSDTNGNSFHYLQSIYKKLGIIYAERENYERAVDNYKKSIKCIRESEHDSHHRPSVHGLLGNAYSELGQYKQALVEFDKAKQAPGTRNTLAELAVNKGRTNALLKLIEKQEKYFQEKIEGFLSGPTSIFKLQDYFFKREAECKTEYRRTTKWINFSLFITFIIIGGGFYWFFGNNFDFSIERNAFSLLPYLGMVLLIAGVPAWWTRILLRSRDRWQILREDCFRKAAIMQYIQATGRDEEFRNQVILETINHIANRSGADLLVALHTDDSGPYSATDSIKTYFKKKPKVPDDTH